MFYQQLCLFILKRRNQIMPKIISLSNLPKSKYPIIGLDKKAKFLGKIATNGFTILLGEAGCGKTTLVQKMQQMYPKYRVLQFAHRNEKLSFNADLWNRLRQLVDNKDNNQYVVFIDEFHRALLDNEFPDFISLFLDSIDKFNQHQVYLIGTITHEEYQQWLKPIKKENDHIQMITVEETTAQTKYEILKSKLPQALKNKTVTNNILRKLASDKYTLREGLITLNIMLGYYRAKREAFDQKLLNRIAKK